MGLFVFVSDLAAIIASFSYPRHWPLGMLRLVLLVFTVPVGLVSLTVLLPIFLGWSSAVFAAVVVVVPLLWFTWLRPRARRRETPHLPLGDRRQRRCALALVWLGGIGVVGWPWLWLVHFRFFMMGQGTSSAPMFTIFLGFIPFVFLLMAGLALIPQRRVHGQASAEMH